MSLTFSRRHLIQGLGTLPLATVLADPGLARAAAGSLREVTLTTAGDRKVTAALAVPETTPAPAVMLIHEWWGLNDQIKAVAAELAGQGFVALAVDLYGGKSADSREGAQALMQAVDPEAATDTLVSWLGWLKTHGKVTGKVAVMGWCFGGGWALNASVAEPVDATVVYYGKVDKPAEQLVSLQGPVLGHFATRDEFIDEPMVASFEKAMAQAGKPVTVYWYEADHAFANPTGGRYDEEDAALAWSRTLSFLRETL
jgi:carboxymethylenebutenolidase